jgi:hypothetical protein
LNALGKDLEMSLYSRLYEVIFSNYRLDLPSMILINSNTFNFNLFQDGIMPYTPNKGKMLDYASHLQNGARPINTEHYKTNRTTIKT